MLIVHHGAFESKALQLRRVGYIHVRECSVTCRVDSKRTSHVVFDGAFRKTFPEKQTLWRGENSAQSKRQIYVARHGAGASYKNVRVHDDSY